MQVESHPSLYFLSVFYGHKQSAFKEGWIIDFNNLFNCSLTGVHKGFHIAIPLRIYFTRQELKTRTCSIPRYKAHGSRGYVEQKQKPWEEGACHLGSKKISHKNREISILTIKKRQSEVNNSSTSHREFQRRKYKTENKGPRNKNQNKTQKQYEQDCQSHTYSGTIYSSMYDSDFSITTFPLTWSAPYSG